jgi:hypothetical protein
MPLDSTNQQGSPGGVSNASMWTTLGGGEHYNAPTLLPIDTGVQQQRSADMYGNQQADRTGLMGVASDYQGVLSGTAPSVAQQQLYAGQQAANQNAAQLAAGTRGGGGNQLQAMRWAQAGQAVGNAQVNAQSAQLRAQEQDAARQGLAGVYNNAQQVDAGGAAQYQNANFQAQQDYQRNQLGADLGALQATEQSETAGSARGVGVFTNLMNMANSDSNPMASGGSSSGGDSSSGGGGALSGLFGGGSGGGDAAGLGMLAAL